jgi:hypothetical protein
VPLRPVGVEAAAGVVPPAFEFRTFWWRGSCVGFGKYWAGHDYEPTPAEQAVAESVAGEAARRLELPFVAVDVAQAVDGRWWVIEPNDGQDSGYVGVNPRRMWRRVLDSPPK